MILVDLRRYTVKLREALSIGLKKGFVTGGGMGTIMFVMFATYSLAFWFGSKLISDHTTNSTTGKPWTGGDVVTTFFAVVMGAFAIGQAGPSMQAFGAGRAAAFKIFTVYLYCLAHYFQRIYSYSRRLSIVSRRLILSILVVRSPKR
jgi:hypothetical protein